MEAGYFIPGKYFTKLEDNTIILRFDGDKDGHFMTFKFGVTLMDRPFANAPDSIKILGSLDAEEYVYNLKNALFYHWVDLLNLFFDLKNYRAFLIMSSIGDFVDLHFCDSSMKAAMFENLDITMLDETLPETKSSLQLPILTQASADKNMSGNLKMIILLPLQN